MTKGVGLFALALALAFAGALTWACGGAELERQLPARAEGELVADVVLGSGFSFDKGSLTITSRDDGEDSVRVATNISGWGAYAVEIDAREHDGDVRVTGRVEGFLHWAFGGPTVDVLIQVPPGYRVDARIDGGPLLLEDLEGTIAARAADSEVTLRRVEGDVRLQGRGEKLRVEDVEGAVHLENERGGIEVKGVRGPLAARATGGDILVASVTGPVTLASDSGGIGVERVRGDLRAVSERGRIELDDIEGRVELETVRGSIDVEELAGPIQVRSERGRIDVEFVVEPSGRIESERGSIHLEVPAESRFSLDALTERGDVDLDRDLMVVRLEPGGELPPVASPPEDPAARGRRLAREIRDEVLASVRKQLDGEPGAWDWGWDRDGEGWDWDWGGDWSRDEQRGSWRDRATLWAELRGRRGEHVRGDVNGGGAPLHVRTRRGSIRIEGR